MTGLRWGALALLAQLTYPLFLELPYLADTALRAGLAALAIFLLARHGGVPLADFGFRAAVPGSGRWILGVSLLVIAGYLVLAAAVVLSIRSSGQAPDLDGPRDFHTVEGMWRYLWTACLLAPVAEELLFRGVGVPALAAWVGPRWAIFLSGPIFYAFHVVYAPSRWPLVHWAGAGWLLAYAMVRRRALWVPIVMHALGNVLMAVDDVLLLFARPWVEDLLRG